MLIARWVLISLGVIAPFAALPYLKRMKLFSVGVPFAFPLVLFLIVASLSSLLHPNVIAMIELAELAGQTIASRFEPRRWIPVAAHLVMVESLARLIGRLSGVYWLWITPAGLGWRVQLLACDWMVYTQIILLTLPEVYERARRERLWLLWLAAFEVVLFFSGQRSAWLAALVMVLILCRKNDVAIVSMYLAAFMVMGIAWGDLVFEDRDAHAAYTTMIQVVMSDMSRFSMWKHALQEFWSSPLIGSGLGSYIIGDCRVYCAIHAHNVFLDILAKSGLVGAALWIWALFKTAKTMTTSRALALFAGMIILSLFGQVYWIIWLSVIMKTLREPSELSSQSR
jgi:O-antigen ligase